MLRTFSSSPLQPCESSVYFSALGSTSRWTSRNCALPPLRARRSAQLLHNSGAPPSEVLGFLPVLVGVALVTDSDLTSPFRKKDFRKRKISHPSLGHGQKNGRTESVCMMLLFCWWVTRRSRASAARVAHNTIDHETQSVTCLLVKRQTAATRT